MFFVHISAVLFPNHIILHNLHLEFQDIITAFNNHCNICEIIPHDNCLITSLSVFIYDNEDNHLVIRECIVNHIVENLRIYNFFILGDELYGLPITKFNY